METNTGKTLADRVREADDRGLTVCVIGMGAESGAHAAMIATLMAKPDKIMIVRMEDLSKEDQDEVATAKIIEKNKEIFSRPPIVLKAYDHDFSEELIKISDHKAKFNFNNNHVKRKKLKGYQKRK